MISKWKMKRTLKNINKELFNKKLNKEDFSRKFLVEEEEKLTYNDNLEPNYIKTFSFYPIQNHLIKFNENNLNALYFLNNHKQHLELSLHLVKSKKRLFSDYKMHVYCNFYISNMTDLII